MAVIVEMSVVAVIREVAAATGGGTTAVLTGSGRLEIALGGRNTPGLDGPRRVDQRVFPSPPLPLPSGAAADPLGDVIVWGGRGHVLCMDLLAVSRARIMYRCRGGTAAVGRLRAALAGFLRL